MHWTILHPAMKKIVGQSGLFNLGMTIDLREENILNSNCLKTDLLSHPAYMKGLGKYIYLYMCVCVCVCVCVFWNNNNRIRSKI